ncbi:Pimeloyl-ACP methyl ester carboxylesterase [Cribrihabitans marinus]|uniref:Pimeloyl-ACP methyl ester carboxylesterase n=1 Tax=Cribrihabitans marinus TaxID=1227549 RepID=A0A1H6THA3_9RHOB|nr:alpha/beta fold hydrolase [Cribrihabitans marinus]GGH22347.1 alpha/beta hydrolase [Cribrihabitans marinus]SEI75162.1 Pimeloyl-ACP methyl ester carboxylesterase [Cribrihabitans marinus]
MIEPLVLLPGMMCDARIFEHQILHLSRERPVTFAPISQGERIEQIASELLDRLPQRFALAGLSMGGIVAMEVIRRAPTRVTRLCLMSTDAHSDTPQIASAREPLIVAARAGRLGEALQQAVRPEALAPGARRVDVLELVQTMGADLGAEIFVRQMRALQRRPDQQVTLRKIKVPAMILCGRHDRLTPVQRHEFMAQLIPNARLEILEDAGHLPPVEQPEAVTHQLRQWFAQPLVLDNA